MFSKYLNRVDIQVTCLVVIIVAICSTLTFSIVYSLTYRETLNVIKQNGQSIADFIDTNVNTDIFKEVKTSDDMQEAICEQAYALFNEAREISNAKYLYTATKNENGELIYHIDGLPKDDVDFRKVGDLIEPEFQESLLKALDNETVVPNEIMHTEWGSVYVAYYPIHDETGSVVAALGVEFFADNQYAAFESIRIQVLILIIIICIFAGFFAHYYFKRISNPHFRDIYNTDSLTKLKNRNAFDIDVNNYIQKNATKGITLVISDLNGLKPVNDKYGHKMGDFYIKSCAKALFSTDFVVYRIGGDEFATVIPKNQADKAELYVEQAKKKIVEICKGEVDSASISMGCAVCEGYELSDWEEMQKKADEAMYKDKRDFYKNNKKFDTRNNK